MKTHRGLSFRIFAKVPDDFHPVQIKKIKVQTFYRGLNNKTEKCLRFNASMGARDLGQWASTRSDMNVARVTGGTYT